MPNQDMDVASRLDLAMKHRGWSSAELARRAGIKGRSGVNNVLKGHSSGARIMHRLGEALGVSPYWLLTGEAGAPEWLGKPGPSADSSFVIELKTPREIPVIGYAGASDNGQRGILSETPEMKNLPSGLTLIAVRGGSASPVIYDNQWAMVNINRKVRANNVVAVVLRDSGEVLVKRWCPQPDGEHVVLASLDGGRDSLAVHTHEVLHVWPVVGVLYE